MKTLVRAQNVSHETGTYNNDIKLIINNNFEHKMCSKRGKSWKTKRKTFLLINK